jgi:spore coat protein U-like protein
MKPTKIVSSLTLTLIPAVSAWSLQLYSAANYGGTMVENRSGSTSQPCKNFYDLYNDVASSMHWNAGTALPGDCTIILYRAVNCVGEMAR